MSRRTSLLLRTGAAAAATLALCGAGEPTAAPLEVFVTAYTIGGSKDSGETVKTPGQAILQQAVVVAGGATLGSDAAEDAFRNLYSLDRHAPLLLSAWLRIAPERSQEPLGYAYCALRLKLHVGAIVDCFRDVDGDRRFDGALSFPQMRRDSLPLRFTPIDPVRYTAWTASAGPRRDLAAAQGQVRLAYEFDRASNRLLFRLRSMQAFGRADEVLEPAVAVDAAALPATVTLAGSQLRLLGWDGRKLRLRIERPMTTGPILLIPPPAAERRKRGGYRLLELPAP